LPVFLRHLAATRNDALGSLGGNPSPRPPEGRKRPRQTQLLEVIMIWTVMPATLRC
jgi:hypothetical protein